MELFPIRDNNDHMTELFRKMQTQGTFNYIDGIIEALNNYFTSLYDYEDYNKGVKKKSPKEFRENKITYENKLGDFLPSIIKNVNKILGMLDTDGKVLEETDRKEKLNAKQKYDAKRATLDEQLLNRNGYFTDEFGLERQLSDKSPN